MGLAPEMSGLINGFNAPMSSARGENATYRRVVNVELHEIIFVDR